MATIASLIVNIGADVSNLNRNVESAERTIGGLDSRLRNVAAAIAGAFSISAIGGAAKDITERASAIQDAADKIGISAEAVQRLKFAAEQGGASIENIGTSIKIMAGHLQDPSKGATAAMAALGLSVDALRQMTPDQAFTTIADAIAKVPDPLKQSAYATDLFGKSGAELLPAIKAGIEKIGEQAPVMSNALVKAGDDAGDTWDKMQGKLDNLRAQALMPVLDLFLKLPEPIQTTVGVFAGLMPVISQVGIALMAAGGPVAAFGAFTGAMTAAGGFITATLVPAFIAALPFIAVGGAIALGVFAIYEAWKHWDDIVAFFKGAWKYVTDALLKAPDWLLALLGPIGAVVAAFKHWDQISGIAKAVYTAIKDWLLDKFAAVVDAIGKKVAAVTGFFKDMYDKVVGKSFVPDMVKGIEKHFGMLESVMSNPAKAVTDFITGCFSDMTTSIDSMLDDWIGGLKNKMGSLGNIFGGGTGGDGTGEGGFKKNFLSGLGGGLADLGVGLISKGIGAIGNHLKGGEEGMYVNPRRDAFLLQFGAPGFGENSGFYALADLLNSLGRGDLFDALRTADEVETFTNIEQVIADLLARNDLQVRTFALGTRQLGFENFGSGTLAMLHGREAVVPESQAGAFAGRYGGDPMTRAAIERLDRRMSELPRAMGRAVTDALTQAPRLRMA